MVVPKFSKRAVVKNLYGSLSDPSKSTARDELQGALSMVEADQVDSTLSRSYPSYDHLEKTLREIWKEKTTRVPHSHRWAMKMSPNLKEVIQTCLTCGAVNRLPI